MNLIVDIPTSDIVDWNSFHEVFKRLLGFPESYGKNGNAWIDCLTYDDDGLSILPPPPGFVFALKLSDAVDFNARCPEQFEALISWSSAVNDRRSEDGRSLLAIIPQDYSNSTMI